MPPSRTTSAHPAYTVKCPSCGSGPGFRCYGGGNMPTFHRERLSALPQCACCRGLGRLPAPAPESGTEHRTDG